MSCQDAGNGHAQCGSDEGTLEGTKVKSARLFKVLNLLSNLLGESVVRLALPIYHDYAPSMPVPSRVRSVGCIKCSMHSNNYDCPRMTSVLPNLSSGVPAPLLS